MLKTDDVLVSALSVKSQWLIRERLMSIVMPFATAVNLVGRGADLPDTERMFIVRYGESPPLNTHHRLPCPHSRLIPDSGTGPNRQEGLALHEDDTEMTINIALSEPDEFAGSLSFTLAACVLCPH